MPEFNPVQPVPVNPGPRRALIALIDNVRLG